MLCFSVFCSFKNRYVVLTAVKEIPPFSIISSCGKMDKERGEAYVTRDKSAVAISHPLDFLVNPSVYYSLHGCRSKTKAAHWEPQRQLHGNASRLEQTSSGQPSSCVTRDDDGYFLTTRISVCKVSNRLRQRPVKSPKLWRGKMLQISEQCPDLYDLSAASARESIMSFSLLPTS